MKLAKDLKIGDKIYYANFTGHCQTDFQEFEITSYSIGTDGLIFTAQNLTYPHDGLTRIKFNSVDDTIGVEESWGHMKFYIDEIVAIYTVRNFKEKELFRDAEKLFKKFEAYTEKWGEFEPHLAEAIRSLRKNLA